MDYGRTDQSKLDPLSSGDTSFDSQNQSEVEKGNAPIEASFNTTERDLRSLGSSAIKSPEDLAPSDAAEQKNDFPNINPELGKIVDLNMPPGAENKEIKDPSKIIEASFDRSAIKTGNKLSPSAIKEVDHAISALNKTGNVSEFYETARDAMEANLDNSYGRKMAA